MRLWLSAIRESTAWGLCAGDPLRRIPAELLVTTITDCVIFHNVHIVFVADDDPLHPKVSGIAATQMPRQATGGTPVLRPDHAFSPTSLSIEAPSK